MAIRSASAAFSTGTGVGVWKPGGAAGVATPGKVLSQTSKVSDDEFSDQTLGDEIPIVMGTGPVPGKVVYGGQVTVTTIVQGEVDDSIDIDGPDGGNPPVVGGGSGSTPTPPPEPEEITYEVSIEFSLTYTLSSTVAGSPFGPDFDHSLHAERYLTSSTLRSAASAPGGSAASGSDGSSTTMTWAQVSDTESIDSWGFRNHYNGTAYEQPDADLAAVGVGVSATLGNLDPIGANEDERQWAVTGNTWVTREKTNSGAGTNPGGSVDLSGLTFTRPSTGQTFHATAIEWAEDGSWRIAGSGPVFERSAIVTLEED